MQPRVWLLLARRMSPMPVPMPVPVPVPVTGEDEDGEAERSEAKQWQRQHQQRHQQVKERTARWQTHPPLARGDWRGVFSAS